MIYFIKTYIRVRIIYMGIYTHVNVQSNKGVVCCGLRAGLPQKDIGMIPSLQRTWMHCVFWVITDPSRNYS